jgi:hypothetical protein
VLQESIEGFDFDVGICVFVMGEEGFQAAAEGERTQW